MFKNILVPTDLSEKSAKALEIAVGMAEKNGGKVTLLHVVEVIDDDENEEEFRAFYEKLASRARVKMEDLAKKFILTNFYLDSEIILGKRVREIVKFASEHGIDLIVLNSHKLEGANSSEDWATISYRVGILSPCPVLMVK